MFDRRALGLAVLLFASACSAAVQSGAPAETSDGDDRPTATRSDTGAVTSPASTSTSTTTLPPTTTTSTTSTSTTTSTTSTSTTTSTTTTTTIPLDVYDPACVVRVEAGQGLLEIVDEFDDLSVDGQTVIAENGLASDALEPGQLLDVCVDNGLNDIDGSARTERNAVIVRREVEVQQAKLNELFDGYGIRELTVDGISGPVTRQRLCAFRLAVGLPVSTEDMIGASPEEKQLMATDTLPIPFTSAILSERWILIDETCQIMFVGVGTDHLQFVFPTSTGLDEFPTRPQNRSRAFKYNSASHNGGWHDSLTYPAAEDNPLNGNMYRPLYFDGGQAIHGANNVPRSPASHGCARLRLQHMDMLIAWLGLGDVTGATYNDGRINVTVNVQGQYIYR